MGIMSNFSKFMKANKIQKQNVMHPVTKSLVDEKGNPVPFSFRYIKKNGDILDAKNVVCTSANVKKKTHTVKFLDSGEVRTIHDVLLISIDDTRIIVR